MPAQDLADYVNATLDDFITGCYNDAESQVDAFIGNATVSANVRNRCILMCGSEMYHARQAPNGIAQYNDMTGAPVRIARDPMLSVYALLQQHMVTGLPVWGD